MKVHLFLAVLTCISVAEARYGEIRIRRGHGDYDPDSGRLEFQLGDGTWGAVCGNSGFDINAATVACKQLGYDGGDSYTTSVKYSYYYDDIPSAICHINCGGYESKLKDCQSFRLCTYDYYQERCDDEVILSCYFQYHFGTTTGVTDSNSSGGSSTGSIIGATSGAIIIIVLVVFVVACRVYIRYSYFRRRNRAIAVTQQRTPRILIARVTRTVSSGPPPPPAYTPSAPDAGYTPVPARGYQPVPTTDYSPAEPTNTPSFAPNDIPSDPPPEYTPTVSTNVPVPVAPVNENSTQ